MTINLTELTHSQAWSQADRETRAGLVEAYLDEHTPAEQRASRYRGCTKVQQRELNSMMNPPEEVRIFENRLTILGWTVDGDVIVGWYCDSYDEASGSFFVLIKREAGFRGKPETESLTPSTWRGRAAFVRVSDDEAEDLDALYAFR